MSTAEGCVWFQREIAIPAKKRGCHLISDEFVRQVPEIQQIKIGLANVHSKFPHEFGRIGPGYKAMRLNISMVSGWEQYYLQLLR